MTVEPIYHVYHIFGNKVGVTNNIVKRMSDQGLSMADLNTKWCILEETSDIEKASFLEIKHQKEYGYRVEEETYLNKMTRNMKIKYAVHPNTITFHPVNGEYIMPGSLDIDGTTYKLDAKKKKEFIKNLQRSKYNTGKYVYKQLALNILNDGEKSVFDEIREWANERGIYENGDPKTQALKLMEEAGELAKAILNSDKAEIVDAIGDCVVVLTNVAVLAQVGSIESCIQTAYKEISGRTGKMVNGTFVKDE